MPRRNLPFRSWGLVLAAVLVFAVSRRDWVVSAWVGGLLLFYLLFVRRTRCRVETTRGRPCRKFARGSLGACGDHTGLKRGLPVLKSAVNRTMPMFMWPRPQFAETSGAMASEGLSPVNAESVATEPLMKWLAIASLAVAFLSFLRDLVAG